MRKIPAGLPCNAQLPSLSHATKTSLVKVKLTWYMNDHLYLSSNVTSLLKTSRLYRNPHPSIAYPSVAFGCLHVYVFSKQNVKSNLGIKCIWMPNTIQIWNNGNSTHALIRTPWSIKTSYSSTTSLTCYTRMVTMKGMSVCEGAMQLSLSMCQVHHHHYPWPHGLQCGFRHVIVIYIDSQQVLHRRSMPVTL